MQLALTLFIGILFAVSLVVSQKCGRPAIRPYETNIYDRVVGGREAKRNSWPWQARLGATTNLFNVTGVRQYCGATIIDARWVITAAHCIIPYPDANDTFIRVGLHNQEAPEEDEPKSRKYYVKTIINHPLYQNRTAVDNDISILELFEPIQFNNEISPACLPKVGSDPAPGTVCIATGWGVYAKRDAEFPPPTPGTPPPNPENVPPAYMPPMSDVLKQVVMNIVDRNVCNSALHYGGGVFETNICTSRPGQGVCQSDSGGPLVCKNAAGAFELVGVTSWGLGCADDNYPDVFAHVAYYLPWIRSVTGL